MYVRTIISEQGKAIDGRREISHFSVLMIDHNVMRFHVSVHDALAVAVVERLEELVDVVAYIDIVELGVEAPEIGVVDVLEDQRWSLTLQATKRG